MIMDQFDDDELEQGSGFNPADLLRMFLRRKWLFLIPFVLCLGMAYVAIKTMEPIYFSAGQVRVIREATASRTLSEGMPRYRSSRDADRETMTLIRTIITSPIFLQRVVSELNLTPRDMLPGLVESGVIQDTGQTAEGFALDRMVSTLEKSIRVINREPQIFAIGVRHERPELAFRLAREILDRFLEEEQAGRLERSTTTRDFLIEQREVALARLQDAQNRLTEFQRSMLSTSLVGNPVNEQNLNQAESLLADLRRRISELEISDITQHREAATDVLPAVAQLAQLIGRDSDLLVIKRDLTDLEFVQVEAALTNRQGGDSQNLLGTMRLSLDSHLGRRVVEEYPQLDGAGRHAVTMYLYSLNYRDVLDMTAGRFGQRVEEYRTFLTRQPEQAATLSRLQSEVDSAQNMLQNIEQDITRENLSLAASMSEIGYRIVVRRDPRMPLAPIEPDKKKLAMMGFVLALAIGVGLVLLAEMLDRSFKSVQQIESALRLKVIGALPVVDDGPFENLRRRRIMMWVLVVAGILALAAFGLLWVYPRFQ